MWPFLQNLATQITKYSTFFGQLWYMCVFVFRLIVVITIGGPVYGDEQGMFKCSTQEVGCLNQCFNQFSKISHIRFWAFQLLAIVTPTIFFHFYSTYVTGEVAKVESIEKDIEEAEKGNKPLSVKPKYYTKYQKRKRQLGKVRHRRYVSDSGLKEIPVTKKIHLAYFCSVIGRIVTEAVFIYLGYNLFKFMDYTYIDSHNPMDFLWFSVPSAYRCEGKEVHSACGQHFKMGEGGYVPCFVSRAMEKTVFLRYMNVLSAICFLLSCIELVYLLGRGIFAQRRTVLKRQETVRIEKTFHEEEVQKSAYNDGYENGPMTRLHTDESGRVINMSEISTSDVNSYRTKYF